MHDLALRPTDGVDGGGPRRLFGLSLCAGAGGLDLGLALAEPGYRTVGYVERDAFAAAVLVARMEDETLGPAPVWDDVATFDGRPWRGVVDCVAAGYPCQPFSVAGRRRGTADPRHLWPHIARIVGECAPEWVFLENVANHLNLGYREVRGDLDRLGFGVAEGLFTAAEVGAPHRRQRLFVLAHAEGVRGPTLERVQPGGARPGVGHPQGLRRREAERGQPAGPGPAAPGPRLGAAGPAFPPGPGDAEAWRRYLAVRPDAQPAVRRGSHGLAHRVDRLRLCGNGVVPLVAAHAWRVLGDRFEARRD